MKKVFSILLLSGLFISFALPIVVSAQSNQMISQCTLRHDVTVAGETHNKGETLLYSQYGVFCIMDAIYTATDWIFAIVLAIAIIFIIWGAFTIMTAGGNSDRVTTGRNYIIYAIVGFIVALMAKAIPGIAVWFIGR